MSSMNAQLVHQRHLHLNILQNAGKYWAALVPLWPLCKVDDFINQPLHPAGRL